MSRPLMIYNCFEWLMNTHLSRALSASFDASTQKLIEYVCEKSAMAYGSPSLQIEPETLR